MRELIAAADLLPQDVNAQLKTGELLLLARQFEDAKARAFKAMAVDPDNVAAQILRGNAAAGLIDSTGALEDVNEAIQIDPANAHSYASLGTIELEKGRDTEARAAFTRAVDMAPRSVQSHLALANYYLATGRTPAVEVPLLRAIEADVATSSRIARWHRCTSPPVGRRKPRRR